mgnify:CR=1 FL=1
MRRESYRVRYRIDGTVSASYATATLMLYSPSESEAISELRIRGTISGNATVIILEIQKL